jgi:hypothetical protein
MSRSKKKTPVQGTCSASSQKRWKVQNHRTERAMARKVMEHADPDELVLPKKQEVSNIWDGPYDGFTRFDPIANPKFMRK